MTPFNAYRIKANSFQCLQSSKSLVPPHPYNLSLSLEVPHHRNPLLSLTVVPILGMHSHLFTLSAIKAFFFPSLFLSIYPYLNICLFICILLSIINWTLPMFQLFGIKRKTRHSPPSLLRNSQCTEEHKQKTKREKCDQSLNILLSLT